MALIFRNILDETLKVYSLATLDGKLFIPFLICCVYLLFSERKEDTRAKNYLVYPSIVLILILFNPIFIHLLFKYIEVEERIVRIFWPLPMDTVMIYTLVSVLGRLTEKWKKSVLLLSAVFALLLISGFTHSGQSYGWAENIQKMPKGTKEVCDAIYELNLHEPADVMMSENLFYWVRQYNASIRIPFVRDVKKWRTDGVLDLNIAGKVGAENGCTYAVFNSDEPTTGNLEDYGYRHLMDIDGQDSVYRLYVLDNVGNRK